MKAWPLFACSLVITLSACATQGNHELLPEPPAYPSDEWLELNVPLYVEAAERYPKAYGESADQLSALWERRQQAMAKIAQVERELTLTYGNRGRAGAAIRQPAYIHVLGEPLNDKYEIDITLFSAPAGNYPTTTDDEFEYSWITEGASMYELQRWERFCDGGQGMDEPDWQFVTKAGGENNIPEVLLVGCEPPSHGLDDYFQAWSLFCELEPTTAEQRKIVRNSVRPRSVANPCRALN